MNKSLYRDTDELGYKKYICQTKAGVILAHVGNKTYWGGYSAYNKLGGFRDVNEAKEWIAKSIKQDLRIEAKMKYLDKCEKEYDAKES